MLINNKTAATLLLSTTALALVGCGGGGNNGTNNTQPPASNSIAWTPGSFQAATNFAHFCQNPRTGNDPYNQNQPYPDKSGSQQHEKMWLRSWSNDTYLWYRELPDNDPANFTVAQYFDQLKTKATTASGAKKDQFHFARDTADYKKETQSGVVSGYGIEWSVTNTSPPRDFKVAYVKPNSPAAIGGIERGYKLTQVDGVDFIYDSTSSGVDKLNKALFASAAGETHQLTFTNRTGQSEQFSLVAADVDSSPVQNAKVIETTKGKVGYVQFNSHIAKAQNGLIDAVNLFADANVSELVVDLRYNGGGLLAMASQLAFMVAGDNTTQNRVFEKTLFNDKYPTINPISGKALQATPFYDFKIDYVAGKATNTDLPTLALSRVFVLTTANTCSASEAFINGLRGIDVEVIQIGGQTCGKPYGFYPTDNCSTTYFTIQFSGINDKGFGDYADGFKPKTSPAFEDEIKGCAINDDFSKLLGDPTEGLLNGALTYIETGSCPVNNAQFQAAPKPAAPLDVQNVFDIRYQSFLLENKINTPVMKQENK
ncbi:S41 family peptidase [Pseudoalteromonas tunicata]|uniref:S41 family peptidase n=1 Tax=Pseudoalteromonas tunicata TaxID=314281 RepID=UPI00273F3308|nr:S41 family peptidase [Pseudoalteromonas tunicata]MDP5213515.1 S41 family peptidase [Pseudoalteromonas tunicata]